MLKHSDLMSLEQYSRIRAQYKKTAAQHRKQRQIALGDHVTLTFEDRDTIQYQIQEMLYIERHFESDEIQDELDAYVPLIPTGTNFKATMMIEYSSPVVRAEKLQELVGIEHRVYVQIEGHDRVYARADEDLERTTDHKTSAVHFLTFELPVDQRSALIAGATLQIGVDHARYSANTGDIQDSLRFELIKDLAVKNSTD
jgi:predicted alternative tryptophan synthase beta-subunit